MFIQVREVSRRAVAILTFVVIGASLNAWQNCHAGLTSEGLAEVSLVDLNDPATGPYLPNVGAPPSASSSDRIPTDQPSIITSSNGTVANGVPGADFGTPRKRSRKSNGNFGRGNNAGGGGGGPGSSGSTGSSGLSAPNGLATAANTAANTLSSGGAGSILGTGPGNSGSGDFATPLSTASVPGSSVSNPLMPSSISGNSFGFNYTVTPGGLGSTASPLFVDPPLATGYLITVVSGPNILTVTDTTAPGLLSNTTLLTVTFDGNVGTFAPGGTFNFTAIEPGGVTQFTITGISPADVNANPSGQFTTSFTFADNGGTQAGQITETVLHGPEPGSLTLWAVGALSLLGWRQLRRKQPAAS